MGASVCCPERARRVDAEEAYEPFEPDELVYGAGYAGSLAGDNATKLDFTNTPSEQSSQAGSYLPPTARERLVSGTPILPVGKRRHAKKKSRKKGSKKKRKSQLNSEADRARTYHHKISMDAISGESLNLDGDLTHPKYATYPPLEARLSGGSDHLRISEMLRPDNPTLIADLVDLERTERVKSFSRSRPHEHLLPSSVKTTLLEAHTPEPETSIIESLPSVTISVPTEDHTSVGSQELPDDVNFVDYDDARVVTEEEYHRSEALSYTTRRRMEEYNQTSNHRKSTLEELYDLQVEESLPWLTQLVREDEPNRRPRLSAISEARSSQGRISVTGIVLP